MAPSLLRFISLFSSRPRCDVADFEGRGVIESAAVCAALRALKCEDLWRKR